MPHGFRGPRCASTAIYFLIDGQNISAFHRIQSDELWHFYAGSPLTVEVIHPNGDRSSLHLGDNPDSGETFQAVVPVGCWFASHVSDWKSYSLVGCTVAPGFDFADFEMAKRTDLIAQYPQHRVLIGRLTRE